MKVGYMLLGLLLSLAIFCQIGSAKTTITYQYSWYAVPLQNEAFRALIDLFNATQPEIEVKGVCSPGASTAYDRLLTAIAGGAVPDVVHFEASAVIEWASKGLLTPLDEIFTPESLPKAFMPADARECIFGGHVWAVPWHTSVRGLFWNRDMLEEVGISGDRAPGDLNGLFTVARKVTRMDAQGRFTRVGFLPWVGNWYPAAWFWAFGGEVYDPLTKRPTLEAPGNVKAWEWVQDYAKQYPPGAMSLGSGDPFMAGKLAMEANSSSYLGELEKYAPELNYMTGEVPHAPGGRNGTWGGGTAHIIPRGAKHPKEAMVFLKWLGSPEAQLEYYKRVALLPTNQEAIRSILQKLPARDPLVPLLRQMPSAHERPPLWSKLITRLISLEAAEIITLKRNPTDVLAGLQREMVREYEAVFGK